MRDLFRRHARGWAGPPYLTDDPVPVAYRNYEIYIGYELRLGPRATTFPLNRP
jgi:hypothetical protein